MGVLVQSETVGQSGAPLLLFWDKLECGTLQRCDAGVARMIRLFHDCSPAAWREHFRARILGVLIQRISILDDTQHSIPLSLSKCHCDCGVITVSKKINNDGMMSQKLVDKKGRLARSKITRGGMYLIRYHTPYCIFPSLSD